jgi:hypothetical protein
MKTIMKNHDLRLARSPLAAGGLFLGLTLLLCAPAGAQELLKNGNFEAPFPGTNPYTNWTLVYVDGGPGDFAIAGQTTEAGLKLGGRGAHLRPNSWNFSHAYFRQVVTNLTPGASYTLNIQKMKAGFQNYVDSGKLKVYAAMISDSISNAVSGNAASNGPYSLVITAGQSGTIDVQLHMAKGAMSNESPEDPKHMKCSGWFDDFSLTLTP